MNKFKQNINPNINNKNKNNNIINKDNRRKNNQNNQKNVSKNNKNLSLSLGNLSTSISLQKSVLNVNVNLNNKINNKKQIKQAKYLPAEMYYEEDIVKYTISKYKLQYRQFMGYDKNINNNNNNNNNNNKVCNNNNNNSNNNSKVPNIVDSKNSIHKKYLQFRRILIQQIYKQCIKQQLKQSTYYTFLYYMDLYMSKYSLNCSLQQSNNLCLTSDKMLLISYGCYLMALKFQQIYPPSIRQWLPKHLHKQVYRCQSQIIYTIDFKFISETVLSFLLMLKQKYNLSQKQYVQCKITLDAISLDYQLYYRYEAYKIVSAIVWMQLQKRKNKNIYNKKNINHNQNNNYNRYLLLQEDTIFEGNHYEKQAIISKIKIYLTNNQQKVYWVKEFYENQKKHEKSNVI